MWEQRRGHADARTRTRASSRPSTGASCRARRTAAVDVERTSDDPPERIARWLTTVSDGALRGLDHQLLLDLLVIEADPLRWRDIAQTVVAHADDLVRVGYFDQAWQLAEAVVDQAAAQPERQPHARAALEQFGRGSMMKHVAAHLRSTDDEGVRAVQAAVPRDGDRR